MREAAGLFRPFGDQRRALAVIVKPKLLRLARALQAVEVGMDQRRVERIVSLDDGESRRRHLALVAERRNDRARQRSLASAEITRKRDHVARAQVAGDAQPERVHRCKVRQIQGHGSVMTAVVPAPGSL